MAPSRKTSTPQKCKVLWGGKALAKTRVITDTTWAYQYQHETVGGVTITVKAGNKDLALDGYNDNSKTKISEALLRRLYRYGLDKMPLYRSD